MGAGRKKTSAGLPKVQGPWGKEESTFVWGGQGPRGRGRRQGACWGDWKRVSGPRGLTGLKKGTLAGCRSRCPPFGWIWGNHFLISPAPLRRDLGFGREDGEREGSALKVGCLGALQFHLPLRLAEEASRRWVRPLCDVCGGPLTSWCRQRPRCLQAVGRPPPIPLP